MNAGFKGTTPPSFRPPHRQISPSSRRISAPAMASSTRRPPPSGLSVGPPTATSATAARARDVVATSSTSQYPGMSRLSLDSRRTSEQSLDMALKRGASRGGGAAVGDPVRRGSGTSTKDASAKELLRGPSNLPPLPGVTEAPLPPLPAPSLETAPDLPSPPPSPPARGEENSPRCNPDLPSRDAAPTPAQAAEGPPMVGERRGTSERPTGRNGGRRRGVSTRHSRTRRDLASAAAPSAS